MKFDFTPFGYSWSLPSEYLRTDIDALAPILEATSTHLTTNRGTYAYKRKLGEGTFGTTYQASYNDTHVAIKLLQQDKDGDASERHKNETLWDFIKETILQILLYDATKKLPDGPYVPKLYEIAYDKEREHLYIVQEMMDGTFEHLIKSRSKLENEEELPKDFQIIASQLEWLGNHFQFNHRDFKSDNIMYKKTKDHYKLRLIDFGQSCMTWHGHVLSAASYIFPATRQCYRKSRDLTALFFEIAVYEGSYISRKTRDLLHELTTFYAHGKQVDMIRNMNWDKTYDFLNEKNVENPKGIPSAVRKTMKSPKHIRRTTIKHVRSYKNSA
jgi:serine/threonine protein kinase